MRLRQKNTKKQVSQHKRSHKQVTSKKKLHLIRFAQSVVILLMGFLIVAGAYGAKMLADANNLLESSYQPRKKSAVNNDKIDLVSDPISILIMGIDDNDERKLGSARTDSMILLTMNPEKESVDMVSFPRDTYTKINTKKYKGMGKINSAYTYGGDEGAIQAVQDLVDVPINYYVTVDFQAFEEIVDALGGIDIDVPFDINSGYASDNSGETIVPKGKHTLTGAQALAFARVRKVDNDIERGKRQQQVIQACITKAMEIGSVGKYSKVMKALQGHMWTDMPPDTMLTLAKSSLQKDFKFNSYAFAWEAFTMSESDGSSSSMVALYADSLSYISHKLRVSLGLDQSDERDKKGYKFKTNGELSTKTIPVGGIENSSTNSQTENTEENYSTNWENPGLNPSVNNDVPDYNDGYIGNNQNNGNNNYVPDNGGNNNATPNPDNNGTPPVNPDPPTENVPDVEVPTEPDTPTEGSGGGNGNEVVLPKLTTNN